MMSRNEFQRRFVENMNSHRLWDHPFFEIIRENPSKETLKAWAVQAGRIDQAFVTILQRMLSNSSIEQSRPLSENLDDELGNGNPEREHFALFINALNALGISGEEYESSPPTAPTRIICDILILASSAGNPLMSLGMMANEELICPREFPPFYRALQRFAPNSALEYFPVHIDADVEHSRDLINMCYDNCRNESNMEEIFMWQFLDLELNVAFYDALMQIIKINGERL